MGVTRADVLTRVQRCLDDEQIRRSVIWWDRRTLHEGEAVGAEPVAVPAPFEATMVFVDLVPDANWAHPALYLFLSPEMDRTATERTSFPPYLADPPETYSVLLRYGEEPSAHDREAFDNNT